MTAVSKQWPCVWLAAGMIAAFSLSCLLTLTPASSFNPAEPGDTVAGRMLGESRFVVGIHLFDLADKMYHGGQGRIRPQAFENHPFQRLLAGIKPASHVHLSGKNIKEIMPWLWFAIRTNPHNVEAYLVAAFWLRSSDIAKPEIALEMLQDAQANNPFNYQVQMEKGIILLKQNRIPEAESAFEAGLSFWPRPMKETDETARADKATILLYHAALLEAGDRKDLAISELGQILEMFPDRAAVRMRMEELKNGDQPSVLAPALWRDSLKKDEQSKKDHSCERPGEPEPHNHEHHDHTD